ncbi:MAG: PAC2 family protein [Dehalococcoidales bacterium]|nr:PAC2 family protein [Dehalococcoidales bacterium]
MGVTSLVVCWTQDAGRIGPGVADYLISGLNAHVFGEIEPAGFFPLGGVVIEKDVAQFPQCKLYSCPDKKLLIFLGDTPRSEWYNFLNTIFDMASACCRVNEIYTIGGMITVSPHTLPRQLFGFVNSARMKEVLQQYGADTTMDYETPENQRPTINSYLLWLAKKRNIHGASLWAPIPFYLTGTADSLAWRKVLQYLNSRFELGLEFAALDKGIGNMNERLTRVRQDYPELNDYLNRLEANEGLTAEENEKLVSDIEEYLKKEE